MRWWVIAIALAAFTGLILSRELGPTTHAAGAFYGFGKDVKLSDAPGVAPQVALVSGTAYSAWLEESGVKFAKSADGGSTWGSPTTIFSISGGLTSVAAPVMFVERTGTILLAFQGSYDSVDGEILLSLSNDGGASFSAPTNVSNNPAANDYFPSLTSAPNGDIFVSWVSGGGSTCAGREVRMAKSEDRGQSFQLLDAQSLPNYCNYAWTMRVGGNGVLFAFWIPTNS